MFSVLPTTVCCKLPGDTKKPSSVEGPRMMAGGGGGRCSSSVRCQGKQHREAHLRRDPKDEGVGPRALWEWAHQAEEPARSHRG